MGEQRNLTQENVAELKAKLDEMKINNPELEYRFFNQQEKSEQEEKLACEDPGLAAVPDHLYPVACLWHPFPYVYSYSKTPNSHGICESCMQRVLNESCEKFRKGE